VLLVVNSFDPQHARAAAAWRAALLSDEVVIVSPPVFTELMASPVKESLRRLLEQSGIDVVWEMPSQVWERAGDAYREYANLRRGGTLPRRISADFLIAAHAEYHQASMLSFDTTVYQAVFPLLTLKIP